MSEATVRKWLKKVWAPGGDVLWTEAARGGTVGLPDATIRVPSNDEDWDLPIELKFWERTRKGVNCKLRPAQIRYHRKSAVAGRKTALLIGTPVQSSNGGDVAYFLLPGKYAPVVNYPDMLPWVLVGHECTNVNVVFKRMVDFLNSEKFWDGKCSI